MSDSVLTKIRKALIYQLGTITTANGYITNVLHAYDEKMSIENMKEFPSLVVVLDKDRQNSADQQSFNVIQKNAFFKVICILHDVNDMVSARENILQDIEKLLGTNYMLPSSTGTCTATLATVVDAIPFGIKETKPNGGIEISVQVQYRQLRTDPTRRE
jgi:hypothetical protein